jgi:hypothetical protein
MSFEVVKTQTPSATRSLSPGGLRCDFVFPSRDDGNRVGDSQLGIVVELLGIADALLQRENHMVLYVRILQGVVVEVSDLRSELR